MATRTQSRSNQSSTSSRRQPRNSEGEFTSRRGNRGGSDNSSAFSWGEGAGPIIGAALAGAAIGFAAN